MRKIAYVYETVLKLTEKSLPRLVALFRQDPYTGKVPIVIFAFFFSSLPIKWIYMMINSILNFSDIFN